MKQYKNAGFSQTLHSFFFTSFPQKQRKRGLRLIYHLTFLRTCCKDTTFSCNTKLFLSFFSVKGKINQIPPFLYFLQYSVKNKAKRLNFMTILLFPCLNVLLCTITKKAVSGNN